MDKMFDEPENGFDPLEGPAEVEQVEDENDLCDCEPKFKEAQTIPKSAGASLGGLGGQIGAGDTVIVCKNCGKMFDVEDTRKDESGLW